MDYKELINQLKALERHTRFCVLGVAATAIETLLAERDAAVKFLSNDEVRCASCIDRDRKVCDFPCCHCKETGGQSDYWEWRGA